MTATTLLTDLRTLGITLEPHGDKLRFHPREAITAELLAGIKEHKAELLRLLAEPPPLGDLQAQDDHGEAPEGITPSPGGGTIIERHNTPAPKPHSRLLAGNGFPPFPHGPMDPRIIADPVVMCPTCHTARVLADLRTMTEGLCWDWHDLQAQDEQQPQRTARAKRQPQPTKPRTMTIERRPDGWWIANCEPYTVDGETCDAMGPYDTKAEAADDLRGLLRTAARGPHP